MTMLLGIRVASLILSGNVDLARRESYNVRAWSNVEAKAISKACKIANERYNIQNKLALHDFIS